MDIYRIGVNEFLRQERKRKEITQEKLAKEVGCNRTYIAKIENGGKVGLGIAIRIARGLRLGYRVEKRITNYLIKRDPAD